MKTVSQIIGNELDAILDMFSEHASNDYQLSQLSPYEDSLIGYYLREKNRLETDIKQSIRKVAATLGLTIQISDIEPMETWKRAFDRLIQRWHEAQRVMHNLTHLDKPYLENAN